MATTVQKKIRIRKVKRTFLKKGTCSRTLFYILNRYFDHPMEDHERAADPMAGGILQQGYQCGLLFGAVLGIGAEGYRRTGNLDQAIHLIMDTTQDILVAFHDRTGTHDCEDITKTELKSKLSIAKHFVTGKFYTCLKLAEHWAPEAVEYALAGLSHPPSQDISEARSCASEVVRRMGGTEEEMAIVAGFAGGMGLSGNACGALSAAIWMKGLEWARQNPRKPVNQIPEVNAVLEHFLLATDYVFECREITGREFNNLEEHSTFLKDGGCKALIATLAQA